jgi:catechol O-methyltransferase
LRNNPKAIVHAIEEFTHQQRMIIYSEIKLEKSRSLLAEINPPPKVLLEAGTYVGNSAIAWGDMLRTLNGGNAEGVKVFTFELNSEFVNIARDLVELAGLSDIVTVVQGKSTDSIRRLKEESGLAQIDVLFLDHWEEAYLPDLQLCEDLSLLHKGSVILADNTDFPGAPEYLKYVKAGGRGGEGHVKYESVSHSTASKKGAPVSPLFFSL